MNDYIFNWEGGGWNRVQAESLEQAIEKARKMGEPCEYKPGRMTKGLIPVESSFRPWTLEESDALCRRYSID
jgi:hypothetical protein